MTSFEPIKILTTTPIGQEEVILTDECPVCGCGDYEAKGCRCGCHDSQAVLDSYRRFFFGLLETTYESYVAKARAYIAEQFK